MTDESKHEKVRYVLRAKSFERVSPRAADQPPALEADVRAMLTLNHRAGAAVEQPLQLTRTPSRRRRDFWIVLLSGNAVLAGLVAVLPKNPVVLVFGLSGVVLFSVGLAWAMWVVMSDY